MNAAALLPWRRSAGVLLHITSLPGGAGVGDLGPEAWSFLEFLHDAGQAWWQTLPVGSAGKGFSPYASPSSFSGGDHLLSLELLARDGWLTRDEISDAEAPSSGRVRLSRIESKRDVLNIAAGRFLERASRNVQDSFESFVERSAGWIERDALFEAIAAAERSRDWLRWPADLRRRDPAALREAGRMFSEPIARMRVIQYFFDQQWRELRCRAEAAGVSLLGDLPFYPAYASADVWANQRLFELDASGRPLAVAGVPPDYFSEKGQIWESPLYRWASHEADGYAWWMARLARAGALFDAVRLDHFLGFHRAWRVPIESNTAEIGAWVAAPGRSLLSAWMSCLPRMKILAEDLGVMTPEADSFRREFGFPCMRVLQFAFDVDDPSPHRPDQHVENSAVYTGTHDNDTTLGWVRSLPKTAPGEVVLKRAIEFFGVELSALPDAMRRAALESVAHTAIIPMQDLLNLGSDARMNTPGQASGAWRWRLSEPPRSDLAVKMRADTESAQRLV